MGIPPIPPEADRSDRRRHRHWRRAVVGGAVMAATVLAAISFAGADSTPPDPRPNLVMIMTDDQTANSVSRMDEVSSRIGGEGTTFERAYVNFPLCCPSRATFLTGQYAHNHGVLDNEPPRGGFERFEALHGDSNLATWLDDAGYETALVGKYFNGYAEDGVGFVPPGWDEWYGAVAPAQHVYDYGLNENGEVVEYGEDVADFKQDVLTEHAVEVIERSADDDAPLFLDLAYTAPHAAGPHPNPQPPGNCPVSPKPAPRYAHAFDDTALPRPPSFNEADVGDKPFGVRKRPLLRSGGIDRMTRRFRCTLESLQAVDDGAGEVLDALERTGQLENTIVVFTSDNGFFFGEHRISGGKLRHYEEATRVPLMIRGPGFEPGAEVTAPVVNADMAPTFVELAHAQAPAELDGTSLLPLAADHSLGHGRGVLLETNHYAGIHTERWVYVEHGGADGKRELYDLETDPYELRNLAGRAAQRAVQEDLAGRLAGLRDCAGDDCR